MSIFPAIAPIDLLLGTSAVSPIGATPPILGGTATPAFDSGSTIVELSGAGQLLSAVSSFGNNVAVLASGASGLGQNFGSNAASLGAEAQFFVDAFNSLQNTLNGLAAPDGALSTEPLAGQLASSLNSLATATYDNGSSSLSSLAQIGINFQPSATAGGGGSLAIDFNALQAAAQTDAAGTSSLLSQAASAFGDLAGTYTDQTSNLYATLSTQAQTGNDQQSLIVDLLAAESGLLGSSTNLLGSSSGLLGSNTGSLGLATLLALESSSGQGTTASSLSQQLVALNEFSLVSSLLG